VDPDNHDHRIEELFKLYLDPGYRDGFRNAPTLEEARRWFTDFLACVYRSITRYFSETIPRWHTRNVEFVFSVPTTWKDPAKIAETEQLIRNAGFGKEDGHVVEISLTEAEAAAVYVSKQQYEKGDIFLVCDAGGGTTDVNILRLSESNLGQTELEPLSYVEGQPIGSTLIDFRVQKLIVERLESIRHQLPAEPRAIAEKMMRARFETFKCSFGSEAMNMPKLLLYMPGLPAGYDFAAAHIEDSRMIITTQELQKVFDEQIERIFQLIDDELQKLQSTHPRENVSYLVLSGGLGSSPYVQKKLRARYEMGAGNYLNAPNLKILKAPKPQLAVVHGLVMDRVQRIKEDKVVYKERCCRNSYGIVVRQPYDPLLHQGEDVETDPRDRKKWAINQIDWFIKKVGSDHQVRFVLSD
jgi:molecular chaperone DnaK (HSP70)